MDIVRNIRDMSLSEDEKFFAELIKEEFGCNACIQEIKNKDFMQAHVRPLNDFTIYTTAQPTVEGARLIGWRRAIAREQQQAI